MEKTFDEMIEQTPLHELLSEPEKDMVKELLQQVREATIAECVQTAKEELGIMSDSYFIKCVKNLPTDRIIIETDL